MGTVYSTVYNRAGNPVAAKTLVDQYGNDVINPNTGQPLVVPANYDPSYAIYLGDMTRSVLNNTFNPDGTMGSIVDAESIMGSQFFPRRVSRLAKKLHQCIWRLR
jgi:hypothetical protein